MSEGCAANSNAFFTDHGITNVMMELAGVPASSNGSVNGDGNGNTSPPSKAIAMAVMGVPNPLAMAVPNPMPDPFNAAMAVPNPFNTMMSVPNPFNTAVNNSSSLHPLEQAGNIPPTLPEQEAVSVQLHVKTNLDMLLDADEYHNPTGAPILTGAVAVASTSVDHDVDVDVVPPQIMNHGTEASWLENLREVA